VAAEPVAVTTRPLAEVTVQPEGEAPATVVSLNDSRLSAEVRAPVAAIPVRVGDTVAAGALLAELECGDYRRSEARARAALEAARAGLELATYQVDRARSLASAKTLSEEVLNQREAEVRAAAAEVAGLEAGLAQARADVARCRVTAPFTALVMERLAGVGELAEPGRPLLRVLDTERIEASAQVRAEDAAALAGADTVAFRDGERRFPARLRTILPALDARTRAREVRVTFPESVPLPGTSGRLVWRQTRPHVPADLVVRRGGRYGLFVVRDGTALFHPLDGAEEGRPAAVDLPPQTPVVIDGRFALQDGDPVRLP
jgi:RND family efflux transporter MFP subunit